MEDKEHLVVGYVKVTEAWRGSAMVIALDMLDLTEMMAKGRYKIQ